MGALADNGGPTKTRGLLPGNSALDQIPPAQCHDLYGTAPAPDQRGVPRPVGLKCDVGAYEGVLPQFPYFHNLVQNGDAEASAGSPTGAWVYPADWLAGPQFTAVTYGAPGGFPGVLTPTVRANHGANFFAGGNASLSTAYQDILLPAPGGSIDAGNVSFVLSADLGGFGSQADNAQVRVTFIDAHSTLLGVPTTIGPVTAAQRGDETGFRHVVSAPAVVPFNARYVTVQIVLVRVGPGPYNDGYADNVSFILLPKVALFMPLVER